MATTSIIAAVITKYEALTAAGFPGAARPRIDFGKAPQLVGGLPLRPPYVVLRDLGAPRTVLDFERNSLATPRFAFEVRANTLADVDAIVTAVRLNGGTVGQGLGFDFGTLSDLASPKSTHQILPAAEPRTLEPLDKDGVRVHGARLEYAVSVLESA